MLLSAVSVLVVAQPSTETPEGLMNYPVFTVKDDSLLYLIMLHVSVHATVVKNAFLREDGRTDQNMQHWWLQ